jgi:glycosyltransferase involved in cell wall biosynthesis
VLSTAFLVPGDLGSRTGGYAYDRRIISGLRARGWHVDVHLLDGSYPFPTPAARRATASVLATIRPGEAILVDGLAFGAMPDEAAAVAERLALVALVHHPLALETGLSPEDAASLAASERQALRHSRLTVVTSRQTVAALASYGVPAHRIAVIEPGTAPAERARGSRGRTVELLCVASLVPRKGHDVLVEAVAALTDLDWHLTCVGSLDRDPAAVGRLRAEIARAGLDSRVTLAGELAGAALDDAYDRADVFVLPTLYEGYGMVVAEALARGLPVVSTRTGGIGDLVGTSAGLLTDPGDAPGLTVALAEIIGNRDRREQLAAGAAAVRGRLPTWEDAAAAMAEVLERARLDGVQR